MEGYISIKFLINKENVSKIRRIENLLKERGWKKKELSLRDLLIESLFFKFNSEFERKFIETHTPIEFLLSTALKDSKMRDKIKKILKEKNKC